MNADTPPPNDRRSTDDPGRSTGRKVFLEDQMPLPTALLDAMGKITSEGRDGWSVRVNRRTIENESVHGFDIIFASNAGEREIRMEPVHLLDGRGGTPGTFVGYDVIDTAFTDSRHRGAALINPIAKGINYARALETVRALVPGTDGSFPEGIERDNQRRQQLDSTEADPQAPDQLTTRR